MKRLTGKDITSAIREKLKENGYNSRKVSVVYDRGGTLTCATRVSIKDNSVDHKDVYRLITGYQNVEHCPASGETLLGGTHYVSLFKVDGREVHIPR